MIRYCVRRLLYVIPILLGVNLLTFILFFQVNTPDDIARLHLGGKRVTPVSILQWKATHGYDKPLYWNDQQAGLAHVTDTLFWQRSIGLFVLKLGRSETGRDIAGDIMTRALPSLSLALPTFMVSVVTAILLALCFLLLRHTVVDRVGSVLLIILMSISPLFFIIAGQYWVAKQWHWVPVSGYRAGWSFDVFRFLCLPIAIGVVQGLGVSTRVYRTLFLEEIQRDYVRTARAKGLNSRRVLGVHVLKNALIPIVTRVVVVIPQLFLGSLLTESFFGIPGLGSYTLEAIHAQDFNVVRSMVFIGSVVYIFGLLLTDITYAWVDPRIKLG